MSNQRTLTCVMTILAFFSAPTSATAGPEARCDLKMLVKAIDTPLSLKSLQMCSATIDDLLAMVYDQTEGLYTRGRAVSALAYLPDARSEAALRSIAVSDIMDPIRDQSMRSLLALYRSEDRQIEQSFLIELLPRAGPRLTQTIHIHLSRSNSRPARPPIAR